MLQQPRGSYTLEVFKGFLAVGGGHRLNFLINKLTIHTDKKENQIFLMHKEIQSGAIAYIAYCIYEEGLPNI